MKWNLGKTIFKERVRPTTGFFPSGFFQIIFDLSPRYFFCLMLGILGLHRGMAQLLENGGWIRLNVLTGGLSPFFTTQFLIEVFCVPAAVTAGILIFTLTNQAYAFLKMCPGDCVKNTAGSFVILGIPFLTALSSGRISLLFAGLWGSLFLYLVSNGLNLLILGIRRRHPQMGSENLWEVSLILIFIGFYLLGKMGGGRVCEGSFVFVLIGFCFFLPIAVFAFAYGLSARLGRHFLPPLFGSYAVILAVAFGFLTFDLFRFFSSGSPVLLSSVAASLAAAGGLILGFRLKKNFDPLSGLNRIAYFLVVPLMMICYFSPLMFSADPDALGNWGNVMHKTSTTAFWTAELFLRGGKYFAQITSPGIGWMLYNALLMKLFRYDYALIVNAKMLVYALGMTGFYLTIYVFTGRKIVIPCLLLGLAGYMPFYYDYNNWDMWQRYLFYWPGMAACFFYLKRDAEGRKTHWILLSAGFLAGLNLASVWDVALLGGVNLFVLFAAVNFSNNPLIEKWKRNLILATGFLIGAAPFLLFVARHCGLFNYFAYYLYLIKGCGVYASGRVWENPSMVFWPTLTHSFVYFNFMNIKIILSCVGVLLLVYRLLQRQVDVFTKMLAIFILQDLFFMVTRFTGGGDGGTLFYKSAMYGSVILYAVFAQFFRAKNYFPSLCVLFAIVFAPNMIYPISSSDYETDFGKYAFNPTAYINARESLPEKIRGLSTYDRKKQDERFRAVNDRFRAVIRMTPGTYFDDSLPQMPPDFSDHIGILFLRNYWVRQYAATKACAGDFRFSEDYGYLKSNQAAEEFIRSNKRDIPVSADVLNPPQETIAIDVFGDLEARRKQYRDRYYDQCYKGNSVQDVSILARMIFPDKSGVSLSLENPNPSVLMVVDYPYLSKNAPARFPLNRVEVDGTEASVYPTINGTQAVLIPYGRHTVVVRNLAKSKAFILSLLGVMTFASIALLFLSHGMSRFFSGPSD